MDTPIGQFHATIKMTDTDVVGLGHNPILTDTTATVTMIPTEDAAGHIIGTADNITGVLHNTHTQMLISTNLTMITPHSRSSSHRSSLPYSQDHSRSCSSSAYRPARKTLHQNSSHSRRYHSNTCTKRNSRVTIDDPQTDFYSSDENSSGSEEDSNHLN